MLQIAGQLLKNANNSLTKLKIDKSSEFENRAIQRLCKKNPYIRR